MEHGPVLGSIDPHERIRAVEVPVHGLCDGTASTAAISEIIATPAFDRVHFLPFQGLEGGMLEDLLQWLAHQISIHGRRVVADPHPTRWVDNEPVPTRTTVIEIDMLEPRFIDQAGKVGHTHRPTDTVVVTDTVEDIIRPLHVLLGREQVPSFLTLTTWKETDQENGTRTHAYGEFENPFEVIDGVFGHHG